MSPHVSFDREEKISSPPLATSSSPVIVTGDKNLDYFDPQMRPTAPVRHDVIINGSTKNVNKKHSATNNHMSLGKLFSESYLEKGFITCVILS